MTLMKICENELMYKMFYDRNIDPKVFTCGSGNDVRWRCLKCNKLFIKSPNRLYSNLNKGEKPCPFCSGRFAVFDHSLMGNIQNTFYEYIDFITNREKGIYPCRLSINSYTPIHVFDINDKKPITMKCRDFVKEMKVLESSIDVKSPLIAKSVDKKKYYEVYNKVFDPKRIKATAHINLPFICVECGETFTKFLNVRSQQTYGLCDKCYKQYNSSVPERIIYYYIKKVIPDAEFHKTIKIRNNKGRFHFDIFSPMLKLVVEYDGGLHNDKMSKKRDEIKNTYCIQKGYLLIRIREDRAITLTDSGYIVIKCSFNKSYLYLCDVIKQLSDVISFHYNNDFLKEQIRNTDINIKEAIQVERETRLVFILNNSFGEIYPGLLQVINKHERRKTFFCYKKVIH